VVVSELADPLEPQAARVPMVTTASRPIARSFGRRLGTWCFLR
jgi:hypothetical protein